MHRVTNIKLLDLIICLYLAANMLFAISAAFTTGWWDKVYFLYQDVVGAGWVTWLVLYLSVNTYRKQVKPVLILSIAIFIWDIMSYITDWGVNNQVATGVIFGLAVIIVIIYMARDLKWKAKSLRR